MNLNHDEVDYYFLFPYLKCTSKLNINGIDLFPSDKLEGLDVDIQRQISIISNKFFMADNYKIKNMIVGHIKERYDLVSYGYNNECHLNFGNILKIRELLVYLYSSLHPQFLTPFLDIEASNVFVFRTEKQLVEKYESNDNLLCTIKSNYKFLNTESFNGLLNGKTFITIDKDERIFPPYPSFNQNYYQDLYVDINRIDQTSVFNFIIDQSKLDIMFKTSRLMRSIHWYNRSLNSNISDEEQLMYLSVSFESLLDLDKDKNITNRFKNAINILIGNNTKLNAWIDQFYRARSEIVHRGYANELLFSTVQKKGENLQYRDLISYGRRVFQILFNSILNSEYYKHRTNLEELFISNKERIEILIKNIKKNENIADTLQKYENVIDNIIEYKFVGKERILIKDLLYLICKVASSYISKFTNEEQIEINGFVSENDIEKKLIKYFDIHKIITKNKDITLLNKVDIICWHYLMSTIIQVMYKKDMTT